MTAGEVIQMTAVRKAYGGLRPLRIAALAVAARERVAIAGPDAHAAEVLINLMTGASLPDAGEIRVFGRRTDAIADGEAWLASLDRFGIVTERAVMLEGATLAQNLALPLTLDIDPLPDPIRVRAAALAVECDIAAEWLDQPCAQLPAEVRVRAHLARAIALEPELLLMEHPTAPLAAPAGQAFGAVVRRVAAARGLTALMISLDAPFAQVAADRQLTWDPATGRLQPVKRGWFR